MMRPKITTPAVFVSAREMSPAIFVKTARKPSAIAFCTKVQRKVSEIHVRRAPSGRYFPGSSAPNAHTSPELKIAKSQ